MCRGVLSACVASRSSRSEHVDAGTASPDAILDLDVDHAQTGRTARTGSEQHAVGRRLHVHVLPANTRKDSEQRRKGVLKRVDILTMNNQGR